MDAYCGVTRKDSLSIDLVTGSLMTAEPESRPSRVMDLRGIQAPVLRLYPVVDHVADRLAATQAADGAAGDQRSSRIRDLVDLVVLARTQSVDGVELSRAVRAEWAHRGLGGAPVFDPPAMWASKNSSLARAVQACGDTVRFGTP